MKKTIWGLKKVTGSIYKIEGLSKKTILFNFAALSTTEEHNITISDCLILAQCDANVPLPKNAHGGIGGDLHVSLIYKHSLKARIWVAAGQDFLIKLKNLV